MLAEEIDASHERVWLWTTTANNILKRFSKEGYEICKKK